MGERLYLRYKGRSKVSVVPDIATAETNSRRYQWWKCTLHAAQDVVPQRYSICYSVHRHLNPVGKTQS